MFLVTFFRNKTLSSTILIPSNQGVLDSKNSWETIEGATVLYNMVKGSWCPKELLAAGTMNSMLGDVLGQNLPLTFTNDSQGNVFVTGVYGTARMLSNTTMCQSVVLFTDVPLIPPVNLTVPLPVALPTLPIRHTTCYRAFSGRYVTPGPPLPPGNPPPPMTPVTVSNSSSNNALAIGLGVGLGCAAILIVWGVVFLVRRKKQKRCCTAKIA